MFSFLLLGSLLLKAAWGELHIKCVTLLQGVYEPHQDIHMQPFPEGAASQTYSSSLPAQQTASTDRLHPGFPAAGVLQYAGQHLRLCALSAHSITVPTWKSDAGSVCCVQQHTRGSHGARHLTISHMHADIHHSSSVTQQVCTLYFDIAEFGRVGTSSTRQLVSAIIADKSTLVRDAGNGSGNIPAI